MQCVRWRQWRWRGVRHGQQHRKRQQLRLPGPNTARPVSQSNIWETNSDTRNEQIWELIDLSVLYFLPCNPSHLIGSASASVISGEEQFEDYGEGEDVDFTPSSPCPEDDTRTNGFSDLGSSLPSRLVVALGNTPSHVTLTHLLEERYRYRFFLYHITK